MAIKVEGYPRSVGYSPRHPAAKLARDYAVCRQIMQQASRNYTFARWFLPRQLRPHVEALYALMRVGDDRVDVSHAGFPSARAAIADWQAAYWTAVETGDSPHPVLRAYLHTSQLFAIPPELLSPYFRAMTDDLTVTRFPTFADLLYYMEGSAMTVGRVMTYLLGTTSGHPKEAFPGADALSIAMQLSNFWRDIGQDWQLGRVYLPQEDMARFSYSEQDLANRRVNEQFVALMEYQFARTDGYYQQAREAVFRLASGRWGVMSALEIYRSILQAIRRNQYDVFTQKAGASRLQKFQLAFRAWTQVAG